MQPPTRQAPQPSGATHPLPPLPSRRLLLLLPVQAVDATKKRAISQHVDVETFQALVSASHLRPMRGGLRIVGATQGGKPAAPRHFRPNGSFAQPASVCASGTTNSSRSCSQTVLEEALRSGAHFGRAWRAAPAAADRLQLLRRGCEAGALPRLLRLELSSRMLEDILACLDPHLQHQQAQAAGGSGEAASSLEAHVLQAAAAASGFAIAKAGLSLQGRQRMASLGKALEGGGLMSAAAGGSGTVQPVQQLQA